MNPAVRLAQIVTALESAGLTCLVMGGHAVRYYGVDRNTIDYDLHLSPDNWNELPQRLAATRLSATGLPPEGPSWRPRDFRRFQIGRLPDGREEWLEFWRANHLLAPFAEMHARREEGEYGGRTLPFLGLTDLIRSKETERGSDWQDVSALEEILDARLFARVEQQTLPACDALRDLRSRRGLERWQQKGRLADQSDVIRALCETPHPVTVALLIPFALGVGDFPDCSGSIEPVVLAALRKAAGGSGLHLALVEAVRRRYKAIRQDLDRADKEAIRDSSERP